MVIFHCHISLLEGIYLDVSRMDELLVDSFQDHIPIERELGHVQDRFNGWPLRPIKRNRLRHWPPKGFENTSRSSLMLVQKYLKPPSHLIAFSFNPIPHEKF